MGTDHDRTLAAKYDEIYRNDPFCEGVKPSKVEGWPRDRYQALVYLARPGGRLLEIGCGRGEVLLALAPHFDRVVGTELSAIRAERTRQQLSHRPNCRIVNAPLERLVAICNPPFDCIIWGDVIEHIVDIIGAMRILGSLSRPGTQLVTVTPNVAFLPLRLRLLLGRAPTTHTGGSDEGFDANPRRTILHNGGHLHYLGFHQVEMLYWLGGFRPERRLGFSNRLGRLSDYWPTLLSSSVCVSGTFQGLDSQPGRQKDIQGEI